MAFGDRKMQEQIIKHFVDTFLRLQNFSYFQATMAKVGVLVWIQPDSYYTLDDYLNNSFLSESVSKMPLKEQEDFYRLLKSRPDYRDNMCWRIFMATLECGIWVEDDYGSYSDIHLAEKNAIRHAIEYCLQNNIDFL